MVGCSISFSSNVHSLSLLVHQDKIEIGGKKTLPLNKNKATFSVSIT